MPIIVKLASLKVPLMVEKNGSSYAQIGTFCVYTDKMCKRILSEKPSTPCVSLPPPSMNHSK